MSNELMKTDASGSLTKKVPAACEPLTADELETIRLSVEDGLLNGNTSLALRALWRLLELENQLGRISDRAAQDISVLA